MTGEDVQEGQNGAAVMTGLLQDVDRASDPRRAAGAVAESLVEALGARLVIALDRGRPVASAGVEIGGAALERLTADLDRGEGTVRLDGVGPVRPAPAGAPTESTVRLLVLADPEREWSAGDLDCIRLAATFLDLLGSMQRSLDDERKGRIEAETVRESLLGRVPAIVYLAETGRYGAWRYVSPRIEELLGYPPGEWMEDPGLWASRIHPDDRESVLGAEDSLAPTPGRGSRYEYRMMARDGSIVWILDEARIELDPEGTPIWHGIVHDITERKEAELALEQLAARQASLAKLGEQAISGTDLGGLMEAAVEVVRGGPVVDAFVWERDPRGGGLRMRVGLDRHGLGPAIRLVASGDSHAGSALRSDQTVVVDDWESEERFEMPEALWERGLRSSAATVIESEGGPHGVLDLHSDRPRAFGAADIHLAQSVAHVLATAIQRHRADQELRHRVLHDSLTGLPNRQQFAEMLERALERARRVDKPIAVLFLDLDHFKVINDSLGHHVGDELLRIVAPRLVGRLRPADVVARFGGDEFGMLVEDLADEAEAVAIAERIAQALSRPITIEGIEHFVTASIGIAVADPSQGELASPESLVRDADAAMYKAKDRGRARYQLFGEEMRASAMERLETQRRLRHAVDREELDLEYQPILSLRDGALVGVEALVRWRHPYRGVLLPHEFIPVAEESGLVGEIGTWVLEGAIFQAQKWHELRPDHRPVSIAINISPRQVAQPGFDRQVAEILDRTGLEPPNLYLEITESALIEESTTVSRALDRLSRLGVKLVLDDFGTGYSSLAYLSRFPMSALKIDRTFVEKLGGERPAEHEGVAIVEAILAMAEALSLEVIAEGVSEPEQAARLRRMGCHYAQGFAFSYPVTGEGMTELVRDPVSLNEAVRALT